MSDLLTPLQWLPQDRSPRPEPARSASPRRDAATAAIATAAATAAATTAGSTDKAGPSMFVWPTPPFAAYPQALEQQPSEACEIVGLNDKRMQGRLIFFVPDESVAHVQVPPARTTMALRFNQFKSLRVLPPLLPVPMSAGVASDDPRAAMFGDCPRNRYRVSLSSGGEMAGETVGHVETAHGLFLFPPTGEDGGGVQRLFVPREAYLELHLGEPIGEVLMGQNSATPSQIAQALAQQQELRAQRVGDILVMRQLVTPEQLLAAIDSRRACRWCASATRWCRSGSSTSRRSTRRRIGRSNALFGGAGAAMGVGRAIGRGSGWGLCG